MRKLFIKITCLLLFFSANTGVVLPQQLTMPQSNACLNDTILIPVTYSNILSLAALTLQISYDTTVLTYAGYANVSGLTPGLMCGVPISGPNAWQVVVAWVDYNGVNLVSGKLCDIKFKYKGGTSNLNFLPTSELTKPDGVTFIIPTYTNGSINPTIVSNPVSTQVCEEGLSSFSVSAASGSTYLWQIKNGSLWDNLQNNTTYSGISTNSLQILQSHYTLNNKIYRCMVTKTCRQYSNTATLTVNPLPVSAGTITGLSTVCQGQNALTYSVPAITNATSYIWTLPTGASGTSSVASISVSYGWSAVSGNVTVKGHNSCGDGSSSAKAITVNSSPAAPSVGTITQPTCPTPTGSVILNGLPSAGSWTLTRTPGGISTGGTGTSTTITGLASGTYTYTVTNASTCTSPSSANIVINSQPVAPTVSFSGLDTVYCLNDSPVNITGNYSGGTFSGSGVTDNGNGTAVFTPANAGLGLNYPVLYTYTDIHLCTGVYQKQVDVLRCYIEVKAKVILQGAYNSTTGLMDNSISINNLLPLSQPYNVSPWNYPGSEHLRSNNTNIVDWVLLELRDTSTTIVKDRRAGFLLTNGDIVDTSLTHGLYFYHGKNNGKYYITILHRNHLSVMTKYMQKLPNSTAFDFSDTLNYPPYGGGRRAVIELTGTGVGKFAMIAGDINNDGRIRYSGASNDRGPVLTKLVNLTGQNLITGSFNNIYLNEDANMNTVLRYSGSKNDPAIILQNTTRLNNTTAITSQFYTSVPTATVYNYKRSNNGPINLITNEDANNYYILLKSDEVITDEMIDNIQFTVSWAENDRETEQLLSGYTTEFNLRPQGEIYTKNGRKYRIFATVDPKEFSSSAISGDSFIILTLPKNGVSTVLSNRISVMDDQTTMDLGGEYYVSVLGEDKTGKIRTNTSGFEENKNDDIVFSFYPNPASDGKFTINVTSVSDQVINLRLFDVIGVRVYDCLLVINKNAAFSKEVNLEIFPKGTYLIEVSNSNLKYSGKIIVL